MGDPVNSYITAGSIISSLGFGREENFSHIRGYHSGIKRVENTALFDTPFLAACIDDTRLKEAASAQKLDGYTRMEQLFILSLSDTIRQSGIDPSDPACGLILSTTKGNIDALVFTPEAGSSADSPDPSLYGMAERVAAYFHFTHEPIVISNACISGVSALVVASRLIEAGAYKHILVAGGDLLTRFVVTGFQSFKSVSPEICRPYDEIRDGLSLGEACGSLLITSDPHRVKEYRPVIIRGGAITNDANHISGPSRTGDGLYYAISQAMDEAGLGPDAISFVNAHGTATLYNDEMESKALHLAGLDHLPLNSLKPYWGHTLGASGIIETIACMEQLRSGEVFATLGFETCGVPFPLSVSAAHRTIGMQHCVKTASGFGGCNAAIVLAFPPGGKLGCEENKLAVGRKASPEEKETFPSFGKLPCEEKDLSARGKACPDGQMTFPPAGELPSVEKNLSARRTASFSCRQVSIAHGKILLDGEILFAADPSLPFATFIRAAYTFLSLDDRKFYKMDDLCKLGYIAAACLFAKNGGTTGYAPGEVGIVLGNASSSLDTDRKHQRFIDTMGDREASPAVFVYTLPNVVMGELCIRYKIQGENTFFINDRYPESFIREYARLVMQKRRLRACLTGWCELLGETYEARFDWLEQK